MKSLRIFHVPKSVRQLFRTAVRGSTKAAALLARSTATPNLRAMLDPAFRRANPDIVPNKTPTQLRAEEKARKQQESTP